MAQIPRLELPSGGWIDFNDPDVAIRGKHVRAIGEIYTGPTDGEGNTTLTMAQVYAASEYILPALVSAWSLPYSTVKPDEPNALDDLSSQDFRKYVNLASSVIRAAHGGRSWRPDEEASSKGEDVPATA